METLIDIRKVSKTYITGSFKVEALKEVSIQIKAGELVSLVGPSGSGKSTLLHIMGFLDRPDAGEYYFAGHPTASLGEGQLAAIRSRMVGFIFQLFHLFFRYFFVLLVFHGDERVAVLVSDRFFRQIKRLWLHVRYYAHVRGHTGAKDRDVF